MSPTKTTDRASTLIDYVLTDLYFAHERHYNQNHINITKHLPGQ